jgi:signal transduction histidine kinase
MLERLRALIRRHRAETVARAAGTLERLGARARALWPERSETSLGWWIVAAQMALVLLVGVGLTVAAISMLHVLANEQGQARVLLAGAAAHEDLRRMSEDALTSARILAGRPTLQRLLAEKRDEAITPFLQRFCDASELDGCAVFSGPNLVAQTGPPLDWQGILAEAAEQGPTFLALPLHKLVPVLGAFAPLPGGGVTRVYVLRLLDERLARELTRRVGMQIDFVDYRTYTQGTVSALTPLYSAALADGRSAVLRIDTLGLYAAAVPVFASSGEAIAFIDAQLPVSVIDASTTSLIRRLVMTTLLLAVFAIIAGFALSDRLVGPLKALTDAAVRIGRGDFSASIPPGGAAEVGMLARTMEDMRRSLLELTGALRRREAEAQAVLTGIVEGVYAVDADRRIRYLNPQAARLLGIDAGEAVGRFCGEVLAPREEGGRRPCEAHCPILRARLDGSAQAVEHLQTAAGELRTTVITSARMVEGLQVQVIRDETELEAVRRARDSVLANISHEFRTPLAAQLASIELLLDNLETMRPEQRRELAESLQRGTLRLTRLIDNLLESVRIESGQLAIRRQSVDLEAVVEDARALVGSLLATRRQSLEIALPGDLPVIEGDHHRLTQVFVNLLANASKFAPEHSIVRIGAELDAGRLSAWVEDEGPGPPAAEGLFARFGRGSEQEPEPGGLGLGLWIVRSIIERHGGAVTFERTAAGRTRFTVTLPVEVTA